jgi:hypothetical protein
MTFAIVVFRCDECGWIGGDKDIARVDDPSGSGVTWNVCPQCRAAEQFTNLCDEPDCKTPATAGWPSPEGYRRTCGHHFHALRLDGA